MPCMSRNRNASAISVSVSASAFDVYVEALGLVDALHVNIDTFVDACDMREGLCRLACVLLAMPVRYRCVMSRSMFLSMLT